MGILASIKALNCSATLLKTLAFASLAVLVTPSSTAFASDTAGSHATGAIGAHAQGESPNSKPVKAPAEANCRCDLNAVLSDTTPRRDKKLALIWPSSIDQGLFDSGFLIAIVVHRRRLPPRETSPPIYLTTQRFRI
jgi:hypothetical protein